MTARVQKRKRFPPPTLLPPRLATPDRPPATRRSRLRPAPPDVLLGLPCRGVPVAVARARRGAEGRPRGHKPFSRWCIRLGFVVVVVMVTGSLGSGRIQPGEYGWAVPLAIITFCLGSQQLSMLPFRLLGWSRPDCL